ncbi:hypothetical protein HPP92_010397 [Vanilla planifolia]|uniref:DNA 3'-5' helicase n=1 Tax=Vanilla planifolia TaxID=51239 RepID=A0A835R9I6_VANPL|nr:hypothetical protein HPP92_010397 [Vanilla planifolia]
MNMELGETKQLSETHEPLGGGPTIIYVPTRNETTKLAGYLCRSGVRAAAYHAKLPKTRLRYVHEEFQQNKIDIVVATIAFGMGIDKSNVRRIIHYGWPQSLEAYYQEAGRAGRDGKLSDCTLYANFLKSPTLLPSERSEEQSKRLYKMLSDCFRYGLNTAICRAKILVNYFGEDFRNDGCRLCDVCTNGPPQRINLIEEAKVLLHVLKNQYAYEHPKFVASDTLWWNGLARILEDMQFIREASDQVRVSIRNPQITKLGKEFLNSSEEDSFYAYPYADMLLLSAQTHKPNSSFSEWGRGWADPEIRRERLKEEKKQGKSKARKCKRKEEDLGTVKGRICFKFSKMKR